MKCMMKTPTFYQIILKKPLTRLKGFKKSYSVDGFPLSKQFHSDYIRSLLAENGIQVDVTEEYKGIPIFHTASQIVRPVNYKDYAKLCVLLKNNDLVELPN